MSDAVSRHRGVRAVAVLAFGGLALVAGVDVIALVVVDRWRDDSAIAAVAFWILVAIGVVLLVGIARSIVQIVRQPTLLRLDDSGQEPRDGREYVVIDLHSGASTQIPVRAVATPRDEWIGDLDDRLNRAHGQRRLT